MKEIIFLAIFYKKYLFILFRALLKQFSSFQILNEFIMSASNDIIELLKLEKYWIRNKTNWTFEKFISQKTVFEF